MKFTKVPDSAITDKKPVDPGQDSIITPKGRAALIAIETGLVPKEKDGSGWDMTAFLAFWDRFDSEVLQPSALYGTGMVTEVPMERRRRSWWIPVAISAAAIAIGLLALMLAGTRQ